MGRQQGAKDTKPRAPREKRIAAPEETADLKFRASFAVSPYRDLLEELQDAPKGSTLKIAKEARYTVVKWVRELGLQVLWARRGGDLFLKITGEADPDAPRLTIGQAVKEAAGAKQEGWQAKTPAPLSAKGKSNALEERMILAALAQGPQTTTALARVLGCTAVSCLGTLTGMLERRIVECEDGVYRKV